MYSQSYIFEHHAKNILELNSNLLFYNRRNNQLFDKDKLALTLKNKTLDLK